MARETVSLDVKDDFNVVKSFLGICWNQALKSSTFIYAYFGRCSSTKECRSILRDEASVYFNVTAVHVWHLVPRVYNPLYQAWLQWSCLTLS